MLKQIKFKYKVIAVAIVFMVALKFVFGIEQLWVYVLVIIVSVIVNQYYRKKQSIFKKPETIEELNKFVEKHPNDSKGYFLRGQAYLTKFRAEDNSVNLAKKDLNMAIKLDPDNFHAFELRGFLYLSSNKYHNAIEDFTTAIELNPKSFHSYYSRAVAYTQIKNFKNALTDYEKVIDFNPKHAEAYRNMGNVLFKLHKYKEAITTWSQAIELKPQLKNEILPLIKGTEKKLN